MTETLFNLVADLHAAPFDVPPVDGGTRIVCDAPPDERLPAWIDDSFGGSWSAEACAGSNVVAYRRDEPVGFATFAARGMRYTWLRGLAREPGVGIFGPLGVAQAHRRQGLGRALLVRALAALRERGYARALIPAVRGSNALAFYAAASGARVAETIDPSQWSDPAPRTLLMASGNGSNVQAVLDAARAGELPLEIAGVLVNDASAKAGERARAAGVPIDVVTWNRKQETREAYDARLLERASAQRPELVLLLGWMHLLDERFVGAFPNLLNLHPAFLPLDPRSDESVMPDGARIPAFRGARAVRDAVAAASSWTGATVHAVTAETDRGPVFARRPLRVFAGETEADVLARLHPLEHGVVTAAVKRWLWERTPPPAQKA